MKKELDAQKKSYVVASYCHSVIEEKENNLEHIIKVLRDHVKKYRYKHKVSYNTCCHTFSTAKFDADNGEHVSRSKYSLRYLMDVDSLDTKKMIEFIKYNGWSDNEGKMLYPGWNMPCSSLYNLKKRLGIQSEKGKSARSHDILKYQQEEEELSKRIEGVQIQHEEQEVENLAANNDLVKIIMTKFFNKMDNYHEEYVKDKKFIVSEKKEDRSTIKKDKKCRSGIE